MAQLRKLSQDDLDQSLELSQYAFQYVIPKEQIEDRKRMASLQEIWGEFEGDQLLSKLHLLPLCVYIGGKAIEMGGVAGVATWPQHRRKGSVSRLIKQALLSMRSNQQTVSLLHPFDFAFYRKYGWEWSVSHKRYTIEKRDLNFMSEVPGQVIRLQNNQQLETIMELYEAFAKNYNGMLLRSKMWWDYYIKPSNYQIAVCEDEQRLPRGYILYQVKDRIFEVKEFIYLDEVTRRGLWNFICQHDSMIDQVKMKATEDDKLPFLLSNPRISQDIIPYFMARIVDVEAFLKLYPFTKTPASITLTVTDPVAEWNNATYRLEDGIVLKQETQSEGFCCDIQTLTVLLLGTQTADFLYASGKLTGDITSVNRLAEVIHSKPSALFDFF
ncbi:enhanced intracellular survival protein Eis [Ammoniphilus sp. CFH 90114]|uniref:GNAT family N-acetyltransferase n=1 Tax=Ammoniphilus sp. CFH 90114 TaxID=2493665 RepID=UPI00100EF24A|nr:GNAT family N-acetyltransferase [Ammoniphilus sp. CFH 90114]RXT06378.1 GNAT family N-acetyltransferase [Ammoniphilus sp. CFH 90114]